MGVQYRVVRSTHAQEPVEMTRHAGAVVAIRTRSGPEKISLPRGAALDRRPAVMTTSSAAEAEPAIATARILPVARPAPE